MTDAMLNALHAPSHLIPRIIVSICYTAAPHATKQEILTFTSMYLVQSHRAIGDGAGFESMSSWVQGSCTVDTAIYSSFVLFVISKCSKQDKCPNVPAAMSSLRVSTVETGLCELFVVFQEA